MKTLNIGLVGYGFMGRTHSNAFLQAPRFFDLPYRAGPQGRLRAQRRPRQGVRGQLGLRVDRNRLAHARRAQGHRPHRHREPQRHASRDRDRGRQGRQDGDVREAARPQRRRGRGDGRGGRGGGRAEHGLVQLPARAGRHAAQAAPRRGQVRAHLPLPRQVPAGLDDLRGPAAGRRRPVAARRGGRRQRRHRRPARPLHRHRALAERLDHRGHRR